MLFASRIHNADPAPHRCVLCQERFPAPKSRNTSPHATIRVRRDKYVVATTHPANTILNDFRDTLAAVGRDLPARVTAELQAVRRGDRARHGVDQAAHADRVLTRYLELLTAGSSTVRA